MKNLRELYTLLYKEFEHSVAHIKFMCSEIDKLYLNGIITREECILVLNNLHRNRPRVNLHGDYWKHELYSEHCYNWFGNGVASTRLRAEFVNYLIDNHIVDHGE